MNTFQAALVFNNDTTIAFFFYDQVATLTPGFANAGFSPAPSFPIPVDSFMVPGVLSGTIDLADRSNTGVPGFYAYRIDNAVVIQPTGRKELTAFCYTHEDIFVHSCLLSCER